MRLISIALALCMLLGGSARALEHYASAWSSYVGGSDGSDSLHAIGLDDAGNAYLGGQAGSWSIQRQNGNHLALETLGFVAKVAQNGVLQWAADFEGYTHYNDIVLGIAAAELGQRVFAVGLSERRGAGGTLGFLAALNVADGGLLWHTGLVGNLDDVGTNSFNAVSVDSSGRAYVTGQTTLAAQALGVSGYQINGELKGLALAGNADAFVACYDVNGTRQWWHYLGGSRADAAHAIICANDALYIVGETRSEEWCSHSLGGGVVDKNHPAAFVVKMDLAGQHQWSVCLKGSESDVATALAVSAAGEIYVGGHTTSGDVLPAATVLNTQSGERDGFVIKLQEQNGVPQVIWSRYLGGSAQDRLNAVTLLNDGRVALGGSTESDAWIPLEPGSQVRQGAEDAFLYLLDGDDGSFSWGSWLGGDRQDGLQALSSSGDVIWGAGLTVSSAWVGGGFLGEWQKEWSDDDSYGFVIKWQPGAPLPPEFMVSPISQSCLEGTEVHFSAVAVGTNPIHYRWYRNGLALAGATSSNLNFVAEFADDGALYSCLASNVAGTIWSDAATLSVTPVGGLQLILSPPDAASRGARWSLDHGETWLPSALVTNLPLGEYTLTLKALAGWEMPIVPATVVLEHAVTQVLTFDYTPLMPQASRTIQGTNIGVQVEAPSGIAQWTIIEKLAPGLTPFNFPAEASWHSQTRTLTWSGSEASTKQYDYQVQCITSGVYTISGEIYAAAVTAPHMVVGEAQVINAKLYRQIDGTQVTIHYAAGTQWQINETLPAGLSATMISGGLFNVTTDSGIMWFTPDSGGILSYTVSGEPGTYTLSGVDLLKNEPIFGDKTLVITGTADPVWPNIVQFKRSGAQWQLVFESEATRHYRVLTNSLLRAQGWGVWSEAIEAVEPFTAIELPLNLPQLFYRIHLVDD